MKPSVPHNDPAFAAMTMDLLGRVLGHGDHPGQLGAFVAEIRELSGARCVLFIQSLDPGGKLEFRAVNVNPPRRRNWADSLAARHLYEVVHHLPAAHIWRPEDATEAGALLRSEGFDLSLTVPLNVGFERVGAVLLLGLPDESHLDSTVNLLKALSPIVALALRNAFFYEKQEEVIRQRTGDLEAANRALRENEQHIRSLLAESERTKSALLGLLEDQQQAEVALRESEERFRALIRQAGDGFELFDAEGRLLEANDSTCQQLGYTRDELLRLAIPDIDPWVTREEYIDRFKDLIGRPPVTFESLHRRKDQTTFPVEVTTSVIQLGGQYRALALARDITERKRTEMAMRDSEERYRSLFENATVGIYRTTPAGRIEAANATLLQMLRYGSIAELQQRDLEQAGFEPSYPRAQFRERIERDGEVKGLESSWTRRDGTVIFVRESARVARDAEGKTQYYEGVVEDITERKSAEKRIREQAALLEVSHDGIIVWDPSQGVQYMNPAAEDMTGRKFAEVHSQELAAVLRPRSDLSLRGAIQEVMAHGSWTGELALMTGGNKLRDVASRWTMLPDAQGRSASVLITCNDITEKKQLEVQYLRAQRLESIGTLASGIAHDLNNILTPIIMGADLLDQAVGDDSRGVLTAIKQSAQRGRDTIRQLLTFARGAEFQKGPVQPRHLIKEIGCLLQQTFPKNIQIYTDYGGTPATVLADPSQLHQVLMNLCVNARDAMPEGGTLFLTLENQTLDETTNLHPKARPLAYVVFKVSDSGVGIPPEILDRIFDPFFTTKPQGKGTGLGLAAVLGIVEGHGGFVLVESELGKGTTFQVYLPASAQRENTLAPAHREAIPQGRGELILVVDDEPAILRIAEDVLIRGGFSVITASGASEAEHLFEVHRDRIGAVLTDIMMPFGDGRQLITLLYEMDQHLPIIAMSGHATREFQRETLTRGARAYIGKPFTAEQLLTLLHEALQSRPS